MGSETDVNFVQYAEDGLRGLDTATDTISFLEANGETIGIWFGIFIALIIILLIFATIILFVRRAGGIKPLLEKI